jgi:hypothetical protein
MLAVFIDAKGQPDPRPGKGVLEVVQIVKGIDGAINAHAAGNLGEQRPHRHEHVAVGGAALLPKIVPSGIGEISIQILMLRPLPSRKGWACSIAAE